MTNNLVYLILLSLISFASFADDEDDDLELFFSSTQKSTLNDFPLQEIGGEELSNASIDGALQTNTSSSQNKKAIYLVEQDKNNKQKVKEGLDKNELLNSDKRLSIDALPISAPEFQQPIYHQPNGRTYSQHQTQTISRP